MWILQCLLKKSREQLPTETTTTNSSRMIAFEEENEKDCDEFELEKGEEVVKNSVAVLLTRVNSRTCFYSTLNLKNLRSFFDGGDPARPAKEERMVAQKVLPLICDATLPNSVPVDYNGNDGSIKKKRRVVSQMKEILKWAATSKSDRRGHKLWKVLYFHNKDTHKTSHNKTSSVAAGKINFRWDVGSSSTASSTFSTLSFASSPASLLTSTKQLDCTGGDETHTRMGHWITTDSEFVVLEF